MYCVPTSTRTATRFADRSYSYVTSYGSLCRNFCTERYYLFPRGVSSFCHAVSAACSTNHAHLSLDTDTDTNADADNVAVLSSCLSKRLHNQSTCCGVDISCVDVVGSHVKQSQSTDDRRQAMTSTQHYVNHVSFTTLNDHELFVGILPAPLMLLPLCISR